MQLQTTIARATDAQTPRDQLLQEIDSLVASGACRQRRPFKLTAAKLKRWPFAGPDGNVIDAARRGCWASDIAKIEARQRKI